MAPRSKGNGAKDTETPAAPGPEQVSPSVASALVRGDGARPPRMRRKPARTPV